VGLTPASDEKRIVCAMHVAEKIPFAQYWPQSKDKRADLNSTDPERHCGDNIYEPLSNNARCGVADVRKTTAVRSPLLTGLPQRGDLVHLNDAASQFKFLFR